MKISTASTRLVVILSLFLTSTGCRTSEKSKESYRSENASSLNVVLVGWDGLTRNRVLELLAEKRLPNLQRLIDEGSLVAIDVAEAGKAEDDRAKTSTKPGWAQILTGYQSDFIGVKTNLDYGPIPLGYTVFERLKAHFGKSGIVTQFITGKINNTGARGPHEICVTCGHRSDEGHKTHWWRKDSAHSNPNGRTKKFVHREGEPYFNALSSIDLYEGAIGNNANVLHRSLSALNELSPDKPFFSFFHFEEPDEMGHRFGEASKEYLASIVKNDEYLGIIRSKLELMDVARNTIVIVTSDHGMDPGKKQHKYAPHTILAANITDLRPNGDRGDVAPTIYELYGVPTVSPPLHGRSLLTQKSGPRYPTSKPKTPVPVGYFHGGRTLTLYRAMAHGFFNAEGIEARLMTRILNEEIFFQVPVTYSEIENVDHFGKVTGTELTLEMRKSGFLAATVGETAFIKDVTASGDLIAIAELGFDTSDRPGHAIALRKGVKVRSPADYKNLKWASRRSSGGDDLFLREFLASKGLDADKDVNVDWGVDEKQLKQRMRDGTLDAAFYHLYALRRAVMENLVTVHARFDWVNPELSQALLVVPRETLSRNRDTLKKFIKGYLRRIRLEHAMTSEERRMERGGVSGQKGLVMEMDFQGMNLPQYRAKPTVRLELLHATQRLLLKHKMIDRIKDLGPAIDNSLVEEALLELNAGD